MSDQLHYEIVEDTSPIAFYKPARIIITRRHYEMLVVSGLIKPKSDSAPYEVLGTLTKRQLQYHAAHIADRLRALVNSIDDAPAVLNPKDSSSVSISLK